MSDLRRFSDSNATQHLIGLVMLGIVFLTGCTSAPSGVHIEITPYLRTPTANSAPTALPGLSQPKQLLRISNQSNIPIKGLVVHFPVDQIVFGNVPVGTTTEYHEVQGGVYRYAAYTAEVNRKNYEQPVVDWIGEAPIEGTAFTYIVKVDPQRWETAGQVIQLVRVKKDK
jgi:hypothetical protein